MIDSLEGITTREKTKQIKVRGLTIGGGSVISIQSMTNTNTADADATLKQIEGLESAGCEIVRFAVPDMDAADAIKDIRSGTELPLVADVHFDHKLAIAAMENGVDKVRINPGNIGSRVKVVELVDCAKHYGVPIRIGVNGGSLPKHILEKFGGPTKEAMVEAALKHVSILERCSFYDIVVSLKSSSVDTTIDACKLIAKKTDYPLHLGVTEAGYAQMGIVKSAMGIGSMLLSGIGDTLRVSLTGDPVQEVHVAKDILCAAGLRQFGPEIVSCPTCGRCKYDLEKAVIEVKERLKDINQPIKVAIMGCVVNGPGEAVEADIGIAGGKTKGIIFKKGKMLCTMPMKDIVDALVEEIMTLPGVC